MGFSTNPSLVGTLLLNLVLASAPQGVTPAVPRFAARTSLVVLSATALDRNGKPITDLRPQEFRVFEDGRPQPVAHFSQAGNSPLRVLLLADASGSMNATLKSTSSRMALLQILHTLGPEDQAALAGFDDRYFGLVPFTRDRGKVEAAFGELQPFGTTALHDALDKAALDLASHGEGRRAVVVITDGVDTASRVTPDEVIARSRALDVPIYAISVVSPLDDPASPRYTGRERPAEATKGAALLQRYAELSGGTAFTVSEFGGLKQAADRIVGELKHQYRLGYDPPPGPSRFRRIAITTTRKGVSIKTRSGYTP
jgi:Ca-activated chloride channel family protein